MAALVVVRALAVLVAPDAMVRGTTMGLPTGLPAADDRRDVIDFLEAVAR